MSLLLGRLNFYYNCTNPLGKFPSYVEYTELRQRIPSRTSIKGGLGPNSVI
jgi:hypothetical protein